MKRVFLGLLLSGLIVFGASSARSVAAAVKENINDGQDAVAAQKINLVWQPTFEKANNLAELPKINGVNVIAPSWLSIVGGNGYVRSTADLDYVKKAHDKGYMVWALITNSFDPELTHQVLADPAARQYVVQQLLFYAERYSLDGINLDFENVYDADKAALTGFVQEIADGLKGERKIVSMDLTVPSNTPNWSTCYDRKSLGSIVDYVMLMAYDEHWRSSPVSGSVASLDWVEKSIAATLCDVPAKKVVLGVPFYMRLWEEQQGRKVSAKTLSMMAAENLIAEKKLQPQWLPEKGQYYFEYTEEDSRYRVWQEDERSIMSKVDLISTYDLAGVASWRKGFEKPEIWPVIDKAINRAAQATAAPQAEQQNKIPVMAEKADKKTSK